MYWKQQKKESNPNEFGLDDDAQFNVDLKTQLTMRMLLDQAALQKFQRDIQGYLNLTESAFIILTGYLKKEEIAKYTELMKKIPKPKPVYVPDPYNNYKKVIRNWDWSETEKSIDEFSILLNQIIKREGISYRRKQTAGLISG